jgi:hypothetical protein
MAYYSGRFSRVFLMTLALWLTAIAICLLLPQWANADETVGTAPVPQEVESYAVDFGVSHSEASQAMQLQTAEEQLPEEVKEALGTRYAGIWFDNAKNEFVIPVVAPASVATLSADIPTQGTDYRTERVSTTWGALEREQEVLTRRLFSRLPSGAVLTYLDSTTNSVVIEASDQLSSEQKSEITSISESSGVPTEIVYENESKMEFGDLQGTCNTERNCSAPLHGASWWGYQFGNGETEKFCSVGYTAVGNQDGNRFMMSAGHCVSVVEPTRHAWAELPFPTHTHESRELGPLVARESTESGYRTDWSKYNITGSYWDPGAATPVIAAWGEGENYQILSEGSSYIGQEMCHSGATTGTSCGPVYATDAIAHLVGHGSATEEHMTLYGPACGGEGDSGGPVYSGHTAFGVSSGATEAEVTGCGKNLSFPEITQVDEEAGVHIGPRVGLQPVAKVPLGFEPVFADGETILRGTVDSNCTLTNYHFDYGSTSAYGKATLPASAGESCQPIPIEQRVPNLSSRTLFHFRLMAQNGVGSASSADLEFITPAFPPVVSDVSAQPGKLTATFRGTVDGRGLPTTYRFEFGSSPSELTRSIPVPSSASGTGSVEVIQTATEIEGVIYYRLAATNEGGTTYSGLQQVYVQERPAIAATAGQTHIGSLPTSVTGTVNPHGVASMYFLEYGPTSAYGSRTATQSAGSGGSAVPISAELPGGKFPKTLHVRFVAENSAGVRYGPDVMLTPGLGRYAIDRVAGSDVHEAPEYHDISCWSSSGCLAVGFASDPTVAAAQGALATEWDGFRWTSRLIPIRTGTTGPFHATRVSCPPGAGGVCEVEGYAGGTENAGGTEIEEFAPVVARRTANGEWQQQSFEAPAGDGLFPLPTGGIECTSTSNCVAAMMDSKGQPAFERWNGSSWHVETPALTLKSGYAFSLPSASSCASSSFCAIVGTTTGPGSTGTNGLYMERLSGSTWTAEVIPSPTEGVPANVASRGNVDVSCPSASDCEVVTSLHHGGQFGYYSLFAERWNGSSWETQALPDPTSPAGGRREQMSPPGISCTSPTACELVGWSREERTADETYKPVESFIDRFDGSTWQQQAWPGQSDYAKGELAGDQLIDISCPEAEACLEIGAELSEHTTTVEAHPIAGAYLKTPRPFAMTAAGGPTGVTSSEATLAGTASSNWAGAGTAYFEYGTTTAAGSTTPAQSLATLGGADAITATLKGLQEGVQYHYRLVVTAGGQTAKGEQLTFETHPAPQTPLVTTGTPTVNSPTTATLTGTVNPNGQATTYYFEYGVLRGSEEAVTYSSTPAISAGSGRSAVPVSQKVLALEYEHLYIFRLVASNASGTSRGQTVIFRAVRP